MDQRFSNMQQEEKRNGCRNQRYKISTWQNQSGSNKVGTSEGNCTKGISKTQSLMHIQTAKSVHNTNKNQVSKWC